VLFNSGRAKSIYFFRLFSRAEQALVRTHQIVPVPDLELCPFGRSTLAKHVQDAWLSLLAPLVRGVANFMLRGRFFLTEFSLPCSWAIGPSTREAQKSFNVVARRQQTGPFVSDTKLRFQDTADHSYMGNGTTARASFGGLMHHGDAIVIQGPTACNTQIPTRPARNRARRVND
jgi:hypothetical protein